LLHVAHARGPSFLLLSAKKNEAQAKLINWDELQHYIGSGGVRMEDDVVITADVRACACCPGVADVVAAAQGYENLTILPTTAEEIEEVMARKA
jgi:Xaa-Pro aminopeptidase